MNKTIVEAFATLKNQGAVPVVLLVPFLVDEGMKIFDTQVIEIPELKNAILIGREDEKPIVLRLMLEKRA